MKFDLNDKDVWDKWRAAYNTLSDADQLEFANAIAAKFPTQQHATRSHFDKLFGELSGPASVIEIGGWKGELADYCLKNYPLINEWLNVEFCSVAAENYVCSHPKYEVLIPYRFDWFKIPMPVESFDVALAAHVIEHLSDEHLGELVHTLSGIKTICFEAPIGEHENNWSGYEGTHILKMGWQGVNALMRKQAYAPQKLSDTCYIYRLLNS